ncbi:MAG: hypothetical protein K2Q23_09235, partial [Bryobacteraceae bacterium]|nr:hypothetical protein [Bryobacteraceae bacterium]
LILTLAPTIAAPCESSTRPNIIDRVSCAEIAAENAAQKNTQVPRRRTIITPVNKDEEILSRLIQRY